MISVYLLLDFQFFGEMNIFVFPDTRNSLETDTLTSICFFWVSSIFLDNSNLTVIYHALC